MTTPLRQFILKRGNTAVSGAYTGPAGEVTYDTTLNAIRVHDGVTAGGNLMPSSTGYTSLISNVTVLQGNVTTLFANAAAQQILINTINANVAAANALIPNLQAVSSNILPAANVTYSLGSAAYQWKDLWVSNNTIYIGNTPIRVSGDTLLVNNASITGNLDINGTGIAIAAGASETYITISPSPEGYAYVQVPNDATANVTNVRIHNDAGNIELGTNSGSSLWYFKNNGDLNLPTNGGINFNGGGILQTPDENFEIRVQDANDDGFAAQMVVDDGAGNALSRARLRRDEFRINVDLQGASHDWTFNNDGQLYLPGNLQASYGVDSSFLVTDNGTAGSLEMKVISYIGDSLISRIKVDNPNVSISTSGGAQNWTFNNTGTTVFPDGWQVDGINGVKYTDGTAAFASTQYDVQLRANSAGYVYVWSFGLDGNLVIPGNSMITTANASSGLGGKTITIQGGASDADTWNSNPGGTVNIVGGYGSFADGGGGNGGDVNITGGASSDANPGIVNINSGANTWAFDYQGGLTLPNGHIVGTNNNSLLLWSEAQDTITLRTEDDSSNFYNFIFDTGGNVSVPGRVSAEYVVVSGGLISTGASPAPIISGFRSISTSGNYLNGEGNITASGNLVASRGAFITGNLMVYGNATMSNIAYTPTTSSDWSAPAPTTLGQAVDRLAALVKTLNGGTGA